MTLNANKARAAEHALRGGQIAAILGYVFVAFGYVPSVLMGRGSSVVSVLVSGAFNGLIAAAVGTAFALAVERAVRFLHHEPQARIWPLALAFAIPSVRSIAEAVVFTKLAGIAASATSHPTLRQRVKWAMIARLALVVGSGFLPLSAMIVPFEAFSSFASLYLIVGTPLRFVVVFLAVLATHLIVTPLIELLRTHSMQPGGVGSDEPFAVSTFHNDTK